MINEEIRQKFYNLIENLNDEGIEKMIMFIEVMENFELYDKRISPEQLREIKLQKKLDSEIKEKQRISKLEDANFERAKEKVRRMKEKKANLPSKYQRLFKRLESVSDDVKGYSMKYDEMIMFNNIYEGNLFNAMTDIFDYGFVKGQTCEKNKQRRSLITTREEKTIA